jgi:catechol 2,3-dioxygenase-like lactoylglutathione lyase family enzyme
MKGLSVMILATRHVSIVVQNLQESLVFRRDVMCLQVAVDLWEEEEFVLRKLMLSVPFDF